MRGTRRRTGVGFGVARGVGLGVGLAVGLGVALGVGFGVGFGVGLGVAPGLAPPQRSANSTVQTKWSPVVRYAPTATTSHALPRMFARCPDESMNRPKT